MTTTTDVYERIAATAVVPVVAIESADSADALAAALQAGGLPVAEITFRTDAAADVIRRLKDSRPDMLVGAGTVLSTEAAREAKACGAEFAVAPGLNPDVVKAAQDVGLPMAPGVMTPSDVEQALSLDVTVLKFFPAEAAGGLTMLKSLAAPYAHRGVRFIPTGGIKPGNMCAYLSEPSVMAVGGTWIAKKDMIAAGEWDTIETNCREAVAAAASTAGE